MEQRTEQQIQEAITEADDYEKATKDLLLLWEASKYI